MYVIHPCIKPCMKCHRFFMKCHEKEMDHYSDNLMAYQTTCNMGRIRPMLFFF